MANRDIDASDPALAQAWKEMSDQKSENNWSALTHSPPTPPTTHRTPHHSPHRTDTPLCLSPVQVPIQAGESAPPHRPLPSAQPQPQPQPQPHSGLSPSVSHPFFLSSLLSCPLLDKVLKLSGQGSGGYNELLGAFDQGYVMFGALKVIGKDNRQTLEAFRPKYVFFTYIGDKVSVLQRAKVSVQRGAAEKIFNGYSTRLDVNGNLANFTRLEICKELLKCGGAHTPTHYIFGPGDEVEVATMETTQQ